MNKEVEDSTEDLIVDIDVADIVVVGIIVDKPIDDVVEAVWSYIYMNKHMLGLLAIPDVLQSSAGLIHGHKLALLPQLGLRVKFSKSSLS